MDAAQFIAGTPSEGADFFDAKAKAIKYGDEDVDLGPHHLRHTKANALLLKVLGNCVDIGLLARDFPWVAGVLPPDDELAALLRHGGQCGQGLQAISMLLVTCIRRLRSSTTCTRWASRSTRMSWDRSRYPCIGPSATV